MPAREAPEWAKLFHLARTRLDRRVSEYHSLTRFHVIREVCESEIERMLACQLLDLFCPDRYIDTVLFSPADIAEYHGCGTTLSLDIATKHYKEWIDDTNCLWAYGPRTRCGIFPQVKMWDIRVDFLIMATDWDLFGPGDPHHVVLVVECDGHDFHERTKEQAKRDRRRDRLLTAAGIPFLRFTGSEIYRDSMACMQEIENLLWQRLSPQSPRGDYPPRANDQEFQSDFPDEDIES